MALSPGDKLGPYEILALVGKGGMGEVYRAHDSRLNRDVAIKVSNAQFSERFTREARTIASLNHTNICHLYDVGPNYLVMEYVEGPDLRGPIDFEDAFPIIQQVIDGIEAAHEKNIIHRDLKPANIKITPEGVVKILDFGLAKLSDSNGAGPGDASPNPENSPTLTIGATAAGTILGTAAYMAPEQAKGKQADKRSDIWSFGVVLYEVLTGKKLFTGESAVEILGAVLNKDADISAAPPRVHKLLRWCLEKDRKLRLASISDARRLLSESEVTDTARQLAPTSQSRFGRLPWMAVAVMTLVAAALGIGYYRATRPAELKPLVRLDVDLGSDVSLDSADGTNIIVSPDGMRLVYVSYGKLFTRKMDQPRAVEMTGSDGAYSPFFSPDGQWVAFFASGKLKKISVEGGTPIVLCAVTAARGGSWGTDDNIIATLNSTNGVLSQIPAAGGTPTPITELVQAEVTHRWPQILPRGESVLFTSSASANSFDGSNSNIEVVRLADHRRKTLIHGGTFGRYLTGPNGSGHLLYVLRGTLFAVPFDSEALELRGTPSPVIEGVAYSKQFGFAQVSFSGNGTVLFRLGEARGTELVTVASIDSAGKTQPLLVKPDTYLYPRLSPDGKRLAVSTGDVWAYEFRRDALTRLTYGGAQNPIWTPDGRYLVYRNAGEGMFWIRSDGAGKPQILTQTKDLQAPFSFTREGKRLLYHEQSPGTGYDLWTLPIESDGVGLKAGKPEVFLQTPADERQPSFSPDGHWIAYASNESGVYQVYVRAFPDKGGKWQISSEGGLYPEFSPEGHELFFRTENSNQILAARYTIEGNSFVADKPRVWSEKPIANTGTVALNYDVVGDGKRIVALMPAEKKETQQSQSHVIFLENFADELQRKVPVGK